MDRLLVVAVPFFGPILIGYIAGRLVSKHEEGLAWLNFFVIYVALPPLFFLVIAKTPFEQLASGQFIVSTGLSSYVAYTIAFVVAFAVLHGRMKEAALAGGIGGYGNVGYMGPGLAVAFLGPEAAAPMALVFAVDCVLFFILIPLLVALGEDHADVGATLRLIVRRVALNPFIIATLLGVAASYFELRLPAAVDRSLEMLRASAAPAALFALGVTVALRRAGRIPVETAVALVVKLLLHPLIVYVVLSYVGDFDRVWIYTAIMMAALPPALSVFVLATQFRTYEDRASTAVLVGTMASMPTLLVWLYLLENRILPVDLFP